MPSNAATPDHYVELADFVLTALPDSISQRRKVLSHLIAVVPARNPCHRELRNILTHLDQHELAQRAFPFAKESNS